MPITYRTGTIDDSYSVFQAFPRSIIVPVENSKSIHLRFSS